MKKMTALLMAMVLVLACVSAYAATPSKTVTNNSYVSYTQPVNVVEEPAAPVIEVTEEPEVVANEIAKVFAFVTEQQEAPINYFPAETKEAIKTVLTAQGAADVTDEMLEKMELNEFIAIQPMEYIPQYGDVEAQFTFVTQYAVGQKVVAMLSIYTGELDADGNPIVVWVALDAEVQADGSLSVVIPQAEMLRMQTAEAVGLAVLSEAK